LKSLPAGYRFSQKPEPLSGDMRRCCEKARGARAKTPGGSGGAQAARNTGPVIRIAIAKKREKLVMAWLLADGAAGIKHGFRGMKPLSRPTS
jgi:hypothetical protein